LQLLLPHLWNISCRRLTAQTVNTSWVTLTATSRFRHVLLMTLQKFVDENGALVSSSVCHFPPAHHNVQRQPRTVGRLNGPLRAPTFIIAPATTTSALSQETGSTWANLTFQRQLLLAHFLSLRWFRILQIAAVELVKEMPSSIFSRSITAGRRDAPSVFAQAETLLLITVHLPGRHLLANELVPAHPPVENRSLVHHAFHVWIHGTPFIPLV
jgi:hypothetical protein